MLQRIAARPSARWPLVGATLLAALVAMQLRDDDAPTTWQAPAITLHVKMRPGAVPGFPATREFKHLPAGTHDGRERWYSVRIDPAKLDQAEIALTFHPDVEDVVDAVIPSLPNQGATGDDGDSCPIVTPSYAHHQEYVGPAPGGVDAPFAWQRGVTGKGVWFADIEGGWNSTHEDLPGERITNVHGEPTQDRSWRAHGTAVLGEVVGKDNGKGVTGLAPDVERVFTASIFDGTYDVADTIDDAAEALRPGDVLLIELQGGGPRGRYLPMEYWDDVYEAIRAATDRGVVVIEAAGNGGENLDHNAYRGVFTKRDSGAIMVGAGAPPRPGYQDRARLDFSNYGKRVDVQGWGYEVATLDYGDLQSCDDDSRDRHYTGQFSGTSSASPIVAGAAVLLESATNRTLSPRALRDLLRSTGTPQTGNTRQNIGPRPDLARALAASALSIAPPVLMECGGPPNGD